MHEEEPRTLIMFLVSFGLFDSSHNKPLSHDSNLARVPRVIVARLQHFTKVPHVKDNNFSTVQLVLFQNLVKYCYI